MSTVRQRAAPKVILWPDGKRGGRVDLSRYCTGFTYTKAMQQAAGSWSVDLNAWQGSQGPAGISRQSALERLIRPNAVISIGMDEPGGITMGLVDQFNRVRSLAGPNAGTSLQLSGSDFGKIFSMDHIVHASLTVAESPLFLNDVAAVAGPDNALVAALPGVWGPNSRDGVPTFLGASVQDVVNWLIKTGPSMRIPLLAHAGGSGAPGDFIRTDDSITTWNGGRVWSEAPHTFNGSLWDFVRKILDEDFYELFIDTVPRIGSEIADIRLTVRPKPFDETEAMFLPVKESTGLTWETLRTRIDGKYAWDVQEYEVFNESLGLSDADVFAYYLVSSDNELIGNPDGLAEGLFYPAVDLFALQRAGLRSYEGRLSLVASDMVAKQKGELDYDRDVGESIVEFRNRLFNWYRLSEYFEAGSIVVAGRDRYRVGDPVTLGYHTPFRSDEPGARYYCVSTTHQWELGSPYRTTLRLTRGHNSGTILRAKTEIAEAGIPFGNPGMFAAT